MQPVRSLKNQYRGINAHLMKFLYVGQDWGGFHNVHITDLAKSLQRELRTLGYEAGAEQGLQIRHYGDDGGTSRVQADVAVYDPDPIRAAQPPAVRTTALAHELVLPAPELLGTETDQPNYAAVAIYEVLPDRKERGDLVAWIELLSPSNKPGSSGFEHYREKRAKLLQGGIVFVELDYLHELPATFEHLRKIAKQDRAVAFPYHITVIDPRPQWREGIAHVWQFRVDEPIPLVQIPLSGADVLRFDFNAPYQRSFEEMFYGDKVDYAELPRDFAQHTPFDQARIVARMIAVLEAHARGDDLEAPPLTPLETPPLNEALARLNALRGG
jgi:hypothetical protein